MSRRNDTFLSRSLAAIAAFSGFQEVHGTGNERLVASELLPQYWELTVELLRGYNWTDAGTEDAEMISLVLETWRSLLLHWSHATARPFAGKIRDLLRGYISLPDEKFQRGRRLVDQRVFRTAIGVFVALPKPGDRDTAFINALEATKRALLPVLHATQPEATNGYSTPAELPDAQEICNRLELVEAYLSTPTPSTISVPIKVPLGTLINLTKEISSLSAEHIQKSGVFVEKASAFVFHLPQVHLSILQLLHTMVLRLSTLSTPFIHEIVEMRCVHLRRKCPSP